MSYRRAEKCEHEPCGYEQRLEYCPESSEDKAYLARSMAEIMDELLYEATEYTHEHIVHSATPDYSKTSRRIVVKSVASFRGTASSSGMWIQDDVFEISRLINADNDEYRMQSYRYDFATGRMSESAQYSISLSRDGLTNSTVSFDQIVMDEKSTVRSRHAENAMSYFDYDQLFFLLNSIYDMHNIEQVDNERSASEQWE